LEGPRFGILTQKETTLPEEELTPDTELYPEESFEQIEQNRKEDIAARLIIEGPAANRQVLFKPRQFPEVELDVEVTIRLKFWVLPDGTVADVVPLQRGDVRLERAAIEYLKNWRFTPVPRDQPQVWGILPITYTFIKR
jgi:TonB family protein